MTRTRNTNLHYCERMTDREIAVTLELEEDYVTERYESLMGQFRTLAKPRAKN